jgi:hypothetical protein
MPATEFQSPLLSPDDDDSIPEKQCIDEMLQNYCGEFGPWQLKHFVLTSLAWALEAFHTMIMIFADREPEWRCLEGVAGLVTIFIDFVIFSPNLTDAQTYHPVLFIIYVVTYEPLSPYMLCSVSINILSYNFYEQYNSHCQCFTIHNHYHLHRLFFYTPTSLIIFFTLQIQVWVVNVICMDVTKYNWFEI